MAHYKGAASEGNRAVTLLKRREQAREEFEFMKKRISEVQSMPNQTSYSNIVPYTIIIRILAPFTAYICD